MATAPRKFRVPGKPYAEAGSTFISEFSDFLSPRGAPHSTFPIARIFEIFPINPATSDLAQQIIARGGLERDQGKIKNHGEFIDALFNDETLHAIAIPLEEDIECGYAIAEKVITLSFTNDNAPDVSFAHLPEEVDIASNQKLMGIELSISGTIYSFSARDNSDDQTQVWVDFALDFPKAGDTEIEGGGDGDDDGGGGGWAQLGICVVCACLSKNVKGEPVKPTPCPDSWCNSADCVTLQVLDSGERVYGAFFLFDAFSNSDPTYLINRIIRVYNNGSNSFPVQGDPPVILEPAHAVYRITVKTINQDLTSPYHLSFFGHLA